MMDYVPGGDMMGLFMRLDTLPEAEARFYAAQTVQAIESLHRLGYAHRDIKPDNLLLDAAGHLKLADLGLAKCTVSQLSSRRSSSGSIIESRDESPPAIVSPAASPNARCTPGTPTSASSDTASAATEATSAATTAASAGSAASAAAASASASASAAVSSCASSAAASSPSKTSPPAVVIPPAATPPAAASPATSPAQPRAAATSPLDTVASSTPPTASSSAAAAMTPRTRGDMFSRVGTPDYMAPEVLTRSGYGRECDWWSFGCILFEMLVGYAPFYAESAQETADKVLRHTETLQFPQESSLSAEARSLIQQLLTGREDRIGVEAIKAHPFFSGVDWEGLRDLKPPHAPTILSETDTQHFEEFEPAKPGANGTSAVTPPSQQPRDEKAVLFAGFNYRRAS